MADEEDETVVRYRRRLDRTPEKQFERVPNEEKKLICAMRGALENCRTKVDEMKDDLAEKEKAIEEERKRREKAEERLKQCLVNPYGSPEVNSELRDRLPRANKVDPLADNKEAGSSEEEEVDEQIIRRSQAGKTSSRSANSPRSPGRSKKKVRRVLNFETPSKPHHTHSSRDYQDGGTETEDTLSEEEEAQTHHHSHNRRSRSRGKGKYSGERSTYPSGYHPLPQPSYATAGLGYPLGQYVPPLYRPLHLTPLSSMSSFGLASPFSPMEQASPRHPGISPSRSFPLLNSELVGGGLATHLDKGVPDQVQPSAPSGLHAASATAQDKTHSSPGEEGRNPAEDSAAPTSANQKPVPHSELFSNSASSLSSHYPLPSSLAAGGGLGDRPRPAVPHVGLSTFSMPHLAAAVNSPYLDLSMRDTTLLQEEITRLKEANKQLTEKLSSCTQEVETLKLQILAETPNDGTLDSDAARKFTELMAEVKVAEKKRQEAMEARVRQAEMDKEQIVHDFENTLLKASQENEVGRRLTLQDLSSSSEEEDSEDEEEGMKNIKGFKVGHPSPMATVRPDAGRVASLKDALKELERRQQRELHIYQEELQVVMEQRDQALEQLQEEREKQQTQLLRMPAQREQMLMAKISALQREKDRAENTARLLREEQMERQLYISLHKALFPDSALNDNTNTNTADSKLKMKLADDDTDESQMILKEDNQLLEQLRQANQEKSLLQMRCEELEAACKQEKEEKNKLERLNGVLRKKLIAVSTNAQHYEEE